MLASASLWIVACLMVAGLLLVTAEGLASLRRRVLYRRCLPLSRRITLEEAMRLAEQGQGAFIVVRIRGSSTTLAGYGLPGAGKNEWETAFRLVLKNASRWKGRGGEGLSGSFAENAREPPCFGMIWHSRSVTGTPDAVVVPCPCRERHPAGPTDSQRYFGQRSLRKPGPRRRSWAVQWRTNGPAEAGTPNTRSG